MLKRKSYSFAYHVSNGTAGSSSYLHSHKKDSSTDIIADLNRSLNLNDLDRLARERIAAAAAAKKRVNEGGGECGGVNGVIREQEDDDIVEDVEDEDVNGFGSKVELVPQEMDVGELEITAF